ncbi:hypothetical protein H5410_050949 [Solanum commersonii]|uniref:DUF4283 domain-containing protein n=1 Tax=Solanum commersonii TaxID=4109 RepID=A0A9J5WX10_SOLCO|nr:hypothetical protein H5410_050949 [Solanum commersonii]
MACQIIGDKDFGDQAVAGDDGANNGDSSLEGEVHLTNISTNLAQEPSQNEIRTWILKSTTNPPNELQELTCRTEEQQQEIFLQNQAGPNGQKQDHNAIKHHQNVLESPQVAMREPQGQSDQQGNTGSTNLDVIDVENSSHFSFGVKPMDTIPSSVGHPRTGINLKYTNELCQDYVQDQQQTNNTPPSTNPSVETSQAGKSPHPNSSKNDASLSSSDGHVSDNANGKMSVLREEQEKGRGDTKTQQQGNQHLNCERGKNLDHSPDQVVTVAPNNYHKNFPKLSSNFDRHTNSNQQTQQMKQPSHPKEPNTPNENNNKLRQIHATQTSSIELVPPRHTTKQGQPAMIYDMDDFMNKLVVDCKYTLIGIFSTTMPKIELIRKSFIIQTQLNGGVNIAHYNARHVFIDLDNELDYNTVWTQQRMTIEGKLMRIQAWTPNFRPEEETPIVPIWVLLPGLPWHCFKKEFITPLLESVGKVLYLDTASIK